MRTTTKFVTISAGAVFLLSFTPLFAQEEQAPPPSGTINVEQTSDMGAVGIWTMLQPNHESFDRTDATLSMPDMMPGQYSFFTTSPNGTQPKIDIYLGDEIIKTSDTPQISFELLDKMTLRIVVHYTLTIFGKVGVNSDPTGIPFVLQGPNGMKKSGITPAEFSPFPIGNYSVTYSPSGCPQPPVKSGLLQKDGRADFMVELVCDTFKSMKVESAPGSVSTTVDGQTLTFTDVPGDSWFAPYVTTVTKRGVMGGYTDAHGDSIGKFGPADPVTIAQLAKIAHTIIDLDETQVTMAPMNRKALGKWFTKYIASAEQQGWLVFEDGSVDPGRPATRGEVVATLLQIFDIPVNWGKGNVFKDVHRNTPYAGEIETAASQEIVSGSVGSDGEATGMFNPEQPITRAEIAKILITVHEKYQNDSSSSK